MFSANLSLGRKGRALLLLTVLGGLIAGDGSGISSLVGLLIPRTVQAAGTPQAPNSYTPPSGKYVDPAQFLATPKPPPVSKAPTSVTIDPSSPHGFVDGRSQEVPALRTAKARTFLNPDGTSTTRTYAAPVNWKDASGHWQTIDDTLVTRSDGRLHNTAGPLDVSLSTNAASGSDVLAVQAGAASVSFGAPTGTASSSAVSVTSSSAQYSGALPNADLKYRVSGGTVKEDVVLHAAPGGGADAVYRFPLHVKGVTPRQDPDGGVGLYDSSGNEVLVIPPGTMTDSNIDPHLGGGATAPVQVTLDQSAATPVVVVKADGAWLADPARVYPVTVDPSVSIGRSSWEGDDYVTNAYPNNYYAWQADDQIGYYNSSTGTNRTLLGYDISPIVGKRIISATWNGYFDWNYWISASSQYFIRPIIAGWSLTATWNTQPPGSATYIVDSAARNQWRSVDMTGWAVNWANGSWGFAGLRIDEGGYETNQTYWKKLAGDTSANPSYLQVTYQSYASSWSFYNSASDPSSDPVNHPSFRGPAANASTSMPVWVQNNGTDTWTASKYHPSYHLLDSAGNTISYDHTRSTLPGDLAPGQGEWVTATIDGMNPGSYILRWDVVDDTDGFWTSAYGGSTADFRVFVGPSPAPQGPVDRTVITEADRSTLSTTLTAGSVPYATQYRFDASADPSFSATAAVTSGWVAGQTSWQVPPGGLKDGTTYNWHAIAADQFGSSTAYSTVPTFTMDSYQLGMRPTWPSHAVGIGGGSSASVNLATGNLALSLPGITRSTVSQPLSLAPTYNSQAVRIGAWIDDRIPYGLPPGGDPSWPVDTAPSAHVFSGQWSLHVPAPNGCHVQSYGNLCAVYLLGSGTTTESLQLPQGSSLEVYTYINPANAPQELMMQLHLKATNTWAQPYWGPNIIGSGTQLAATVPAAGKWVRLLIPASSLGTGDLTIDGISPAMIGGEAWFDHIGLARPGLGLGFQFGTDGGGQSMRLDAFDVTGLDLTSLPSGDARRSNRIDRVEVHEGDSTTWEFHNQAAAGAPPQLVPPTGLTAILLQHPADSTWTLTDPSGDTTTFSTAGVMTTMDVDSNRSGSGPAFSYGFDTTVFPARLTTITDPLGRKATYAYGTSGSALADRVASVTIWDGRKLSFGYDEGTGQAAGQLTSVTDEEGHATRLGYQAAGLVGTVTSPMGRATTIGYGSATTLDWVMQIQQPATTVPSPAAAPLTSFTYASGKTDVKDPACTADTTTCPNGYTQEVLFDGRHRTTLTRDALTNASTVTYDSQDRPILAVDATGVWTDSAYDDSGHALTTITPVEAQNWGAGTGLYAEYYGNPQLAGLPLLTRNDANVDASWNGASPGAPVPAAGWSARWTGYVNVPSAGSYSFTVTGADGMRLRVGGNLVVDQWANRGAGTFSGTVTLPVGNVPIRLEYSDVTTGASQLHLSMSGTVIAQSSLTAVRFSTSRTVYDTDVNGNPLLGLRGAYYTGALSGVRPVALRTDFASQALDANLGGSFALPAGVSQPYSARWTGLLSVPTATTYSLALAADGNARLYLDGSLVVDWWTHASGYQTSPAATPTLSAGTHALIIEYQEAGASGGRVQLLMNGTTVGSSSLTPNYGLTTLGIAPDGSQTQMVYTGAGLDAAYGLETDSYKTNTDKDHNVTQYHWTTTYDAYGRVTSTNSPKGNADPTPTNYLRSDTYFTSGPNSGLLQKETIAGRGDTTYDYEAPLSGSGATYSSGRTITMVDQRGTWHYNHADDGTTTSVTPPGQAQATVTTYDADGNALRIDDPVNGSATTAYDELGRAYTYSVYDTPGLGQPSASASSTYDLDGRLKTSTDAAGAVTYAYDPRGLVSTITDPAGRQVTITYDAAGKPYDTTLFNVAIVKQRYDALGRQVSLQNHKVAGDVAVADYSVGGYDLSGRITSATQTDGGVHPAATTSYTYDTIGRLETWTDSGNVLHRYYFDLESNRTKQVDGPTTTHQYTYASDATSRLLSVDSNAYTYDPLGTGDVVGRPADGSSRPAAQTLAWDSSGNLAAVTSADGSNVAFVRDALGRIRERVQKNASQAITADTVYRFSGNGDTPSYELDQLHGGTMKSYLDGAAIVYAGSRSGTPTFLFSDIHGNTVATADQNGTATGTIATYDPFGISLATNSANPTSFGFVGKFEKYTDPFANLVLMGARPYDPGLGRFLAVDPVEHGSANDYDYTNQDPINGYDLNGKWSIFGHSVSCDWCGHAVHAVSHAAAATAGWAWDHQDALMAATMFLPGIGELDLAIGALRAVSTAYKVVRASETGLRVGDAVAGSRALGISSKLLGRKGIFNSGSRFTQKTGGWRLGWGAGGKGSYALRLGRPGGGNKYYGLFTHRNFR